MSKKRKLLQQKRKAKPRPGGVRKPQIKGPKSNAKPGKSGKPRAEVEPTTKTAPQPELAPTIPVSPEDAILLVGEGDLSFARALIEHHYCENVTATVLEATLEELAEKYQHVRENVERIEAQGGRVIYGVDATKMGPWTKKTAAKDSAGLFDRIIFNFPHVGGKSTDVNRQVRHNQALLVAFFERALRALAPPAGGTGGTGGSSSGSSSSSIVVTLFEGAPYSLWNVRDLARHAGLQVVRSFRFRAAAYPGYAHARTLGAVRTRAGALGRGAWRGEERAARSYVFVRKGDAPPAAAVAAAPVKKRKRARQEQQQEEDSDDEED